MMSQNYVTNGVRVMKLYDKIYALCEQNGIKPATLAQNLGFSKNFFTEMKSGRTKSPSALRLRAIADYFGIDVDELLDDKSTGVRVPVYGTVPAGIPVDAIEEIIGYEEITPTLAASGKYIALKIKGNSMTPQICDGDTVIVRLQADADTGDTVIVLVADGEATCKKLKKDRTGVWLMPNNPAYEPMYYTNAEIESVPVNVIGKVIELRREF